MTATTDMSQLSTNAQGLVQMLENAAQNAAATRGAGYPQVHEDQFGGIANIQDEIDELREAGFNVNVSAGDRDRMITLGNASNGPIRVARGK